MKHRHHILILLTGLIIASSCGTQKKVRNLHLNAAKATLALAQEQDFIPDIRREMVAKRDTFTVKDGDREILIMKAIKDENGEMVAHDVLDAAVVTARFRNVAERHGKVDIEFQVIVPQSMQDSKWQLRFYPDMFIMQDSIRLAPVIITGNDYRRAQLKGYQQYERFLASIVTDSTKFINYHLQDFIKKKYKTCKVTRSRPNFKNDNARVEERNRRLVREVVGDERLDDVRFVYLLNQLYKWVNLQHNHFIASMRLEKKEKCGRRIIKRYDKARTPYMRVLEKMKEGGRKERFIRLHESLNPWTIKNKIAQYAKEIAMLLSHPQP